jgi:hypothetical protein
MPFDVTAILVLFGAVAEPSPTPVWTEYRSDGPSHVRLEGDVLDVTRKLWEWEVRGEPIEGYFRLANGVVRNPNDVEGQAQIKVDLLRGFKDGVPVGTNMNETIWQRLRASQHPTIVFTLRTLDLEAQPVQSTLPLRCVAQGELAVAGVTNAVLVPLRLQFGEGERLTVRGEFDLKMSDYAIKPPVGGTTSLRSADRVWISFEWQLMRTDLSSARSLLRNGHNQSSQPMPGQRLGSKRSHLARHGWTQR